MIDSTENRAARRRKATRRARSAALVGTAAAAMTAGLAIAPGTLPQAHAVLPVEWAPTYTAGALAGILNWFGNAFPGTEIAGVYNSGPPQRVSITVPDVPLVNSVELTLILKYLANNTSSLYGGAAGLYNTIANTPLPGCTTGNYASNCRYALMLGTSQATLNMVNMYRAQIASVTTGETPAGYIPFTAAPGSTSSNPTWTNEALIFLQNPVRPNGGIMSRFPAITTALGLSPQMPAAGRYNSPDGTVVLNAATIDATWAYDPIADFPEVFNLVSIANSLSAALPLNLLTGGLDSISAVLANSNGTAANITLVGLNLAAVLQMGPLPIIGTLPMTPGQAYYATLAGADLPLLTPMRMPTFLVNTVLKAVKSPYLLGDPLADALQPALEILVNIGYDDVVTPTDGGTYNRTFLTGGTYTPFGSVEPLTPEEKAAVPGDVWAALVAGVQAQLAKPFWGIIVPNPDTAGSGAAVAPASAVRAAAATSAPVESNAAVAEQVSAHADPAPAAAPEAAPAAPAADPALAAEPVSVPDPVKAPAPVAVGSEPSRPSGAMTQDNAPGAEESPSAQRRARGELRRSASAQADDTGARPSSKRHRAAG